MVNFKNLLSENDLAFITHLKYLLLLSQNKTQDTVLQKLFHDEKFNELLKIFVQ